MSGVKCEHRVHEADEVVTVISVLFVVVPEVLVFVGAKAFVEVITGFGVVECGYSGDYNKENNGCSKEINSSTIILNPKENLWSHI